MPRQWSSTCSQSRTLQAVAVERHLQAVQQVGDEQRDDLLRELVRPVVVGAAGDDHVQPVGAVVRQGEQVARRPWTRSTASSARAAWASGPGALARSSRRPRRWRRARTGRARWRSAASSSVWVPSTLVMHESARAGDRPVDVRLGREVDDRVVRRPSARRRSRASRMSPSTNAAAGSSDRVRLARLPA